MHPVVFAVYLMTHEYLFLIDNQSDLSSKVEVELVIKSFHLRLRTRTHTPIFGGSAIELADSKL